MLDFDIDEYNLAEGKQGEKQVGAQGATPDIQVNSHFKLFISRSRNSVVPTAEAREAQLIVSSIETTVRIWPTIADCMISSFQKFLLSFDLEYRKNKAKVVA